MTFPIGINGFGRIGRMFLRALLARQSDLEVVAVNDLTSPDNLAYLLKYDSVHGPFKGTVEVDGNDLVVNGKKIKVLSKRDPAELGWGTLGIPLVVESTGFFTKREGAVKHLEAGTKVVLISAPATDPDLTVVPGVNDAAWDASKHRIVSVASCTTNASAPPIEVLHRHFGVEKALLNTVHAYTSTQAVLDSPGGKGDFRRGRAAVESIIPASTGAAKAIALVLPELKGRLDGLAVRVPVPDGSLVDITGMLEKPVTVESLHAAFKDEAASSRYQGILAFSEDPLVSSDIVGTAYSSIIDATSTMVLGDRFFKILAWYDNEYGYANRVVDMAERYAKAM
ncbi:MAG: type I glyceraldehyde-3-phosphate dehydrogenase [Gloeobacterales cyanobacterium]